MDVVFHLSEDTAQARRTVVNNVTNLVEDETVDTGDVAVVTNSAGVELLVEGTLREREVRALADNGVSFKMCGNSLWKSDHEEADLQDHAEVVSSGVGELARLQEQGYHYLQP